MGAKGTANTVGSVDTLTGAGTPENSLIERQNKVNEGFKTGLNNINEDFLNNMKKATSDYQKSVDDYKAAIDGPDGLLAKYQSAINSAKTNFTTNTETVKKDFLSRQEGIDNNFTNGMTDARDNFLSRAADINKAYQDSTNDNIGNYKNESNQYTGNTGYRNALAEAQRGAVDSANQASAAVQGNARSTGMSKAAAAALGANSVINAYNGGLQNQQNQVMNNYNNALNTLGNTFNAGMNSANNIYGAQNSNNQNALNTDVTKHGSVYNTNNANNSNIYNNENANLNNVYNNDMQGAQNELNTGVNTQNNWLNGQNNAYNTTTNSYNNTYSNSLNGLDKYTSNAANINQTDFENRLNAETAAKGNKSGSQELGENGVPKGPGAVGVGNTPDYGSGWGIPTDEEETASDKRLKTNAINIDDIIKRHTRKYSDLIIGGKK